MKDLDFHDIADDGSDGSSSGSDSDSSRSLVESVGSRGRRRVVTKSAGRAADPDDEDNVSGSETESEVGSKAANKESSNESSNEGKGKVSAFRWAKYNNLTIDSQDLTKHHYLLFDPYIVGFAVLAKKWSKLELRISFR